MKIRYETKGDFKRTQSWLNRISRNETIEGFGRLAEEGTKRLSSNTPKDTGVTAMGWRDQVNKTKDGIEIVWTNVAHPEASVNIAKIIDIGHGTRNGGYVPPRPYIKSSMQPIWDMVDKMVRELIEDG